MLKHITNDFFPFTLCSAPLRLATNTSIETCMTKRRNMYSIGMDVVGKRWKHRFRIEKQLNTCLHPYRPLIYLKSKQHKKDHVIFGQHTSQELHICRKKMEE